MQNNLVSDYGFSHKQLHFNWLVLNYGYVCILGIDRKDENGVNPFLVIIQFPIGTEAGKSESFNLMSEIENLVQETDAVW